MQEWYKSAADHALPSNRIIIEPIMENQVALYRHIPHPGIKIPISIKPFPVDDLAPTEEKIEWVVRSLRANHSSAPPGIRAEQLQQWLQEAQKEEEEVEDLTLAEIGVG